MYLGSRLFVAIIFILLGLSFWAVPIQLYLEFGHNANLWTLATKTPALDSVAMTLATHDKQTWFLLLTHYSDLFLFFPIFGTIALVAFFTPASVLVDMYWNTAKVAPKHRISLSPLRFTVGFVVIILLSFGAAHYMLGGTERTLWQLKPSVLQADQGVGCTGTENCQRVAFLDALSNLRMASRERITLYDLNRTCSRDWFIEPSRQERPARFCPTTTNIKRGASQIEGRWVTDFACCRSQKLFDAAVKKKFDNPRNRSATNDLQIKLWPAHIFFLLTLLVISGLLAFRRKRIEETYPAYSRTIDRGVMIGGIAMVFLPLMHNSFLLTTKLLHGDGGGVSSLHRQPETFSVAFGLWALLIILSFLHPANKQAEPTGRILGVIASIIFALKANTVTDYTIYLFGAGAGAASLTLMAGIAILLLAMLWLWRRTAKKAEQDEQSASPSDIASSAEPAAASPGKSPAEPAAKTPA